MFAHTLNHLLDWVSANPNWAGVAVFAIACFESLLIIGYLMPGIFVLFGIGALIGSGYLSFWPIAIWAACGAVAGDVASYFVGYLYRDRLRRVWPFGKHPELFEKGEVFFDNHGGKSIVFGRFVGPVRPLIPTIAGMSGMSVTRFLVIDIISAALWAPVYLFPGAVFGASLDLAAAVATRMMLLIALLAFCLWVLYRLLRRIAIHMREPLERASNGMLVAIAAASFAAIVALMLLWTPLGASLLPKPTPPAPVATNAWLKSGWRDVIQLHAGRHGKAPLNVQVAGNPALLAAVLEPEGWRRPPKLSLQDIVHWLAPDPRIENLPLLPQFLSRRGENLVLIRPGDDGKSEWVLKLWESGWHTTDGRPISVGRVSRFKIYRRIPLLALPRPIGADDADSALARLAASLQTTRNRVTYVRNPAEVLLIVCDVPPAPTATASAAVPAG
ncbi:MAG TPA: VTT domain-containing protein [Gammaproteobacteria bacterium]|nr:VTT domain-containing protein [Gammaproteobacteria bacterium]